MKKIIYGGLMIALTGIGIFACQKDNKITSASLIENSKLIRKITSSYEIEQSKLPTLKANGWWAKVIGADLTAAGAGALAGAAIGAPAGGIGAVPGAIIGGLLGGAGASFTVAGALAGTANPEGNTGGANSNNPYDFIGDIHYNIVNIMLNDKDLYYPNNQLNYSLYEQLVFEQLKVNYQDCDDKKCIFPCTFYNSEILFHANRDGNIVSYFTSNNVRIAAMSNDVRLIIKDYSQAIQATNNKYDFTQYSINCENIIVNSSLNELDKMQVLSYMAVARYGIIYYN